MTHSQPETLAPARESAADFFLSRSYRNGSLHLFQDEDAVALLRMDRVAEKIRVAVAVVLGTDASNPELWDRVLTDTQSDLIIAMTKTGVEYTHATERQFLAWFYCRAYNAARTLFAPELEQRQRDRTHRRPLADYEFKADGVPDDHFSAVLDVTDTLPVLERTALLRTVGSDERIVDTARRLGVSPATVCQAQKRAIAEVQRKLRAAGYEVCEENGQ